MAGGAGSATFIAGVLVAGHVASAWGPASILWLTAAGLLAAALSVRFAPDLAKKPVPTGPGKKIDRDWLALLRQPTFIRMALAAALVLGSHAMHDAFAIIRWSNAGISPAISSVLWSESSQRRWWFLCFSVLGYWMLSARRDR